MNPNTSVHPSELTISVICLKNILYHILKFHNTIKVFYLKTMIFKMFNFCKRITPIEIKKYTYEYNKHIHSYFHFYVKIVVIQFLKNIKLHFLHFIILSHEKKIIFTLRNCAIYIYYNVNKLTTCME